jgi:hypothetical protein
MNPEARGSKGYFFAVLMISTAFCLFFSKLDLTFFSFYPFEDLGHQMYNFEKTLLGEIPYRDYLENWAPATFYLNAFAFYIFGVSIYSTKLVLAIFLIVSSVALYCISEKVMPRPFAFAVALASLLWGNPTFNIPYSGWFANCFGLLALLGFAKYLSSENKKPLWLTLIGLALGLTFSFKQHIGVLSLAAIAVATAGSAHLTATTLETAAPPDHNRFKFPVILVHLSLLLFGYIVLPFFLLRNFYVAGRELDVKNFVLFVLPVFLINSLIGASLLKDLSSRGQIIDFRKLFLAILGREAILAAGFLVVALPWMIYFSTLMGWKYFLQFIFLSHASQQNFRQTYIGAGQLESLPWRSVLVAVSICSLCLIIILAFVLSTSRKRLLISAVASVILMALIGCLVYPFDPKITPNIYTNLPVALLVMMAMLKRCETGFLYSEKSTKEFYVLTILTFNVYTFQSLVLLVDRGHYQMNVFPWLTLAGYVCYNIYGKACEQMTHQRFAIGLRKAGIVLGLSVPFILVFPGKSLSVLWDQYISNIKYQEEFSPHLPNHPESLFRKMNTTKGGIYANSIFLDQVDEVVHYLRENSTGGDYVFGGPSTAMFNFLADRRFPSKYRYYLFNFLSEEQQNALAGDLYEKKPKYYIYDNLHHEAGKPKPSEATNFFWQFPPVGEYIFRNYEFEKEIGRFYIFRRTDLSIEKQDAK